MSENIAGTSLILLKQDTFWKLKRHCKLQKMETMKISEIEREYEKLKNFKFFTMKSAFSCLQTHFKIPYDHLTVVAVS